MSTNSRTAERISRPPNSTTCAPSRHDTSAPRPGTITCACASTTRVTWLCRRRACGCRRRGRARRSPGARAPPAPGAAEPHAAALHHDAVRREPSPTRTFCSTSRIVLPRLVQQRHGVEHGPQRLRVEAERRLVEQDQLRVEHQRAGELDLPPLAAGEVAGLVAGPLASRSGTAPRPLRSAAPEQGTVAPDRITAEQHVLADRHLREDAVRLRHLHDPAAQDLGRRGAA